MRNMGVCRWKVKPWEGARVPTSVKFLVVWGMLGFGVPCHQIWKKHVHGFANPPVAYLDDLFLPIYWVAQKATS